MKKYGFGLAVLIMSIIVTFISYPYLPEQIAVHWNYKGVPDDFDHKSFGLFLFPGIMFVLYLLTIVLPKIDPKKSNFQRFQGPYFRIMNGILFFLFLVQLVQITSGLGIVNPKYVVPELVGILFIFIGNLSPKFKPNYFVGIRTPWTLANEEVWKKTHRFGGKVFVITGLLQLLVPFVPAAIQAALVFSIIIICLILIVVSSYYFFIKL
ncbi:SdpI family protein [Neobacillus drentensis]|uniref:SdpI family protein n=1 Tax=Neobacillus drentensis TaxID=220684 RepID=UPI001F398E96|nr:SdpI family protein [Neobacillus drentensis]ULT54459.1 SdpI family protein [Neobacillus drentensis]